jgi:hypothetical protein
MRTGFAAGALFSFTGITNSFGKPKNRMSKTPPVIHFTDLFHPHGDPDDHFDLACIFSLAMQGLIDLKEIGIDYPPEFRKGDPDLIAVAQLNHICGLNIPVCIGPSRQLSKKNDTLSGLSQQESVGINRLIKILRESEIPAVITVVGSSTTVAAAALREPALFREKCAGVYLNAGATHQNSPDQLEMNVKLNPAAYAAMFDLPCPLYWFPCWHLTEERQPGEYGTFYWLQHADAFENVRSPLISYFWYMFSKSQDPFWLRMLRAMPPEDKWNDILKGRRGMWSTASILMTAGLTVTQSGEIAPVEKAGDNALFRMEHVNVQCEDNGYVKWELTDKPGNRYLFHIRDVAVYPAAMSKAVNSLFKAFPENEKYQ